MDILRSSDRFQMGGIDAIPRSAKMVEYQSLWNVAIENGVGDAMGSQRPNIATSAMMPTVALAVDGALPDPARIRPTGSVNLFPESFNVFWGRGIGRASCRERV